MIKLRCTNKMGVYQSTTKTSDEVDAKKSDAEGKMSEMSCPVFLDHMNIEEKNKCVADYCLGLLSVRFWGQTSLEGGHTDEASICDVLNLGLYLSLLDKFLRQFEKVTDFTGTEDEYLQLLRLVALKRCHTEEPAAVCYDRLVKDSERFVQIYHKRGVLSEKLDHRAYWGSRQQLLSCKVIADWVDRDHGCLDPLFGVLLQPTSGRVGPGDTGWMHNILFDDNGHMAYHSAVHDAFGYLLNFHKTGPGYNYMKYSLLSTDNPMSGQYSGIEFWKKVMHEVELGHKVIKHVCL